jgi:hypothetical protein
MSSHLRPHAVVTDLGFAWRRLVCQVCSSASSHRVEVRVSSDPRPDHLRLRNEKAAGTVICVDSVACRRRLARGSWAGPRLPRGVAS